MNTMAIFVKIFTGQVEIKKVCTMSVHHLCDDDEDVSSAKMSLREKMKSIAKARRDRIFFKNAKKIRKVLSEPMGMAVIVDGTGLGKTDAVNVLSQMIDRGMVCRKRCATGGRGFIYSLVSKKSSSIV
jgi:DNA-binding MarR family transcriptional regulator